MKLCQVALALLFQGVQSRAGCKDGSNGNGTLALPIVDLPHERHQAISYNEDAGTYNFSNIRFAEAPVGDLRFKAPVPVKVSNTSHVVNKGSVGAICPQPFTLFNDTAVTQWILSYISGTVLDLAELQQQAANQTEPPADPRISEDCLFLDVIVPKKIYDNRGSGAGAPVLVWIYGGGYLIGQKNGLGLHNPTGLLQASEDLGDDGFIFVAMDYRLGAFGFLGGPTVEAEGTPNAGLYDQRLALEFVKENIHLFGGSPDRVTVMGESAGGGSIIHQLTAFGGDKGPAPFQQIITQSTGFVPAQSSQALEDAVETVLSVANVSSFDALRKLPSDVLIAVNNIVTRQLYQGAFHPAVDGVFFDYVRGLIGTNANEGILNFGDPRINTTEAYSEFVSTLVAGISNDSATALEQEVYPPIFDGSQGYTDNFERAYQSFGEFCFTCNQPFTSRGLGNATYNYQFAAPPGVHGQDLGFTFYRGETIDPAGAPFPPATDVDVAVSRVLQSWIASFVTSGVPTALNVIGFEPYGAEGNLLVLGEANNSTHVARGIDPTLARGRCDWLAKRIIDQTLLEAN
ncbi:carboxylesterase family protein [Colletotrichum asianum]|uniref:Carboxylic ester hydrolase n=1 Tax=Colletotrichum asianum TaxID=702518 RepID=A0A8H3WPT5_9PEZI|nr:carboxylesterase family protein [Colletotrichum asianum]